MFLPALTLGLASAAYLSRLTRAGMLEVLNQDFIRTARAKGQKGSIIILRHALRGGLIPSIAFLGPAFAGTISGSVVVEAIFQIPGIGKLFIKAIETGDETLIMGPVLLYGTLIVTANFLDRPPATLAEPQTARRQSLLTHPMENHSISH